MRMTKMAWAATLLGVLLIAGCNSGSPTGASGGISPTVRGQFVGDVFLGLGGVRAASGAADDIIVRVLEDPAVSVKVDLDGQFTLRGLPSGRFTLLFTLGGVVIGTQEFSDVQPNHEITIVVEVVDGEVVVLDERRTGIGHGDIEIEGDIERIISLSTTGESKIVVDGKTVIIKPGETAIRRGNTAVPVTELKAGMQVHVKGVWVEGSRTDVNAWEVKIQDEEDDDIVDLGGKVTICHIPPGNPANRKTLEVGASAVPAHMGHGDTMGPCSAGDPSRNPGDKGKPDKGDKGGKGPKK